MRNFGKLPFEFTVDLQGMVIHPDDLGLRWNIRFAITPVNPALIERSLF